MTTISIIPDNTSVGVPRFRAVAGGVVAEGATIGQAVDALTNLLDPAIIPSFIIIQSAQSNARVTAELKRANP